MKLYLDIETLPTTDQEVIEELRQSISAPANYSKPETIQKWMDENAESALADKIAKTSFDGMYGSIACICYAFDDGEIHSVDCRDGEKVGGNARQIGRLSTELIDAGKIERVHVRGISALKYIRG